MYRHSYSVRLARKLSKMEDVEYPVEMAVVTGELMYRRSLSGKDVFLIDYPEFDNKYSYFYIPPSLVLRDIDRVGIADIAILGTDRKRIDTGAVVPTPIGDGEIIVVRMNHTFVEEYEKWA